jgi:hypothetical protein
MDLMVNLSPEGALSMQKRDESQSLDLPEKMSKLLTPLRLRVCRGWADKLGRFARVRPASALNPLLKGSQRQGENQC